MSAEVIYNPPDDICQCGHNRDEHEHEDSAAKSCRACNKCRKFVFQCSAGSQRAASLQANRPVQEAAGDGFEEWWQVVKGREYSSTKYMQRVAFEAGWTACAKRTKGMTYNEFMRRYYPDTPLESEQL